MVGMGADPYHKILGAYYFIALRPPAYFKAPKKIIGPLIIRNNLIIGPATHVTYRIFHNLPIICSGSNSTLCMPVQQ